MTESRRVGVNRMQDDPSPARLQRSDPTHSGEGKQQKNRAAVAAELRQLLPKIEGFQAAKAIALGLPAIDGCLPHGGLSYGALHEIVPEQGATPAAFGFLVALLATILPRTAGEGNHAEHGGGGAFAQSIRHLPPPPHFVRSPSPAPLRSAGADNTRPVIFVLPAYGLRDYGRPHGHGLYALGLNPERLILVETAHRKATLWALEEALHARAPAAVAAVAAVAGVIDKLDLKSSQRLQLAAIDAGRPLFLLRSADILESSAAATRWRVGPAPAARDRFGLTMRARWRLLLERCRNGRAGEWTVEYDHVAHRFSLAAALADPAFPGGASEKSFQQAC